MANPVPPTMEETRRHQMYPVLTAAEQKRIGRFGRKQNFKAGELLAHHRYNVMVGIKGNQCVPIPLAKAASSKRLVPIDHPWIRTARLVETCMGDVEG